MDEIVTVDVRVVRETKWDLVVATEGNRTLRTVPKMYVLIDSEVRHPGDKGILVIRESVAEKLKLI